MKNKGFTLIELMILVAIIGILFAVGKQSFDDYQATQQPQSEPAQESPSEPAKQDFNPNEVQW